MKTLSYTVSDATATEWVNAVAARHGYTTTVPDPNNQGQTIPNPRTKQQFAIDVGWDLLANELLSYRRQQAEALADAAKPVATGSVA